MLPMLKGKMGTELLFSSFAASGVANQVNGGMAMLSINYANSNVTKFDLHSFYYGCATNLANGVTVSNTPIHG